MRILWAIAQKIRERSDRLASIDQRETGRSKASSLGDIETGALYFEYYAGLVNKGLGDVIDLGAGYHSTTRHEPFGVIAAVLPWNGPVNQAGRGIAPAFATGNTVVAKPPEFTSVTMLDLARIAVRPDLSLWQGTGSATPMAGRDRPAGAGAAPAGGVVA